MTYQPKSAGKMVDFESLTLFISLNSSQVCTYFCKDLVTECSKNPVLGNKVFQLTLASIL